MSEVRTGYLSMSISDCHEGKYSIISQLTCSLAQPLRYFSVALDHWMIKFVCDFFFLKKGASQKLSV